MSSVQSALMVDENTKEGIAKALGRIASGVFIVTLGNSEERDGMLATWIGQCAFEPPIITVGVKQERPILSKLNTGSLFVVNVLGKKNNHIFKNFAKPYAPDVDRFADLSVSDKHAGPVLNDALAYMSCTVIGQAPAGDHVLVLAQLMDGALLNGDQEPMVHLRSNGFQY